MHSIFELIVLRMAQWKTICGICLGMVDDPSDVEAAAVERAVSLIKELSPIYFRYLRGRARELKVWRA